MAHRQSAHRPAIPHQCRHHRRGADGQGAAGARAAAPAAIRPIARGGRVLGEMEEYFFEGLVAGDTFVFAGEVLRFEALRENEAYVSRATAEDPKIPAYAGGKFPLSTYLAERVRALLADPRRLAAAAAAGARLARHPEMALDRCRARGNCWSRPSRTRTSIIWSATRSRAGWRTRPSACCSPGGLSDALPAARLCRLRICARHLGP